MKIMKTIRSLKSDDKGATLVEYGIAITLAIAVGTLALGTLGDAIVAEMGCAETVVDGTVAAAGC